MQTSKDGNKTKRTDRVTQKSKENRIQYIKTNLSQRFKNRLELIKHCIFLKNKRNAN